VGKGKDGPERVGGKAELSLTQDFYTSLKIIENVVFVFLKIEHMVWKLDLRMNELAFIC
jgi:hypothetical protein